MDYVEVKAGAHLRRTIVDRFNTIPAKARIGMNPEKEARERFVDSSGIVVIPRGTTRWI